MSMQSWTVTGWGVKEDSINEVEIDDKINFIKKYLPKVYDRLQADGLSDENTDMGDTSDYLDFCNEWIENYEDDYCNCGFGALFAMAINENEEDFDVTCCHGEYSDENAILYEDRLPWEMSNRVRQMKSEDMSAVFEKYLKEIHLLTSIAELKF